MWEPTRPRSAVGLDVHSLEATAHRRDASAHRAVSARRLRQLPRPGDPSHRDQARAPILPAVRLGRQGALRCSVEKWDLITWCIAVPRTAEHRSVGGRREEPSLDGVTFMRHRSIDCGCLKGRAGRRHALRCVALRRVACLSSLRGFADSRRAKRHRPTAGSCGQRVAPSASPHSHTAACGRERSRETTRPHQQHQPAAHAGLPTTS